MARILDNLEHHSGKWEQFWKKQELLKSSSAKYDDAIRELSNCFAAGVRNTSTKLFDIAIHNLQKWIRTKAGFNEFYVWLAKNKFDTFVLTASPKEVFRAIPDFHFAETYGLVLERNHKYTGHCALIMTTSRKKRIVEEIVKNAAFSFGVSDSIHDLRAYRKLSIKFLLDGTVSDNEEFVAVSTFAQVRRIVERQLKLKRVTG